jgi:hypothetical protein
MPNRELGTANRHKKPPSPGWVGNGGENAVSDFLVLFAGGAAGLGVFRAAGRLRLGIAGRAFLLRGAGGHEKGGRKRQDGGETNHVREWLRCSNRCFKQQQDYLPLTAGGGGGGGAFCWQALRRAEAATRVRIAIFMCCVWVLTVLLWFPSTRLLAAGLSRLTTSSIFANNQIVLSQK